MALFVLRAGYSVETTATGGRVVHNRTRDALELSAAEVQILARAAAGGVDAREPGLRPIVKKLAGLGVLEVAEPAASAGPAEKAAPEAPRLMLPDETVPQLRSDLHLERAERGQVTVFDPLNGHSTVLHEFEVSLARMLNGRRKVADVLVGAQRLGIPASLESLGQFVRQLGDYGFLAPPGAPLPEGREGANGTTWEPREKWDDGARVLFQTGLRLARRGRRAEASRYFQALLNKDPKNEQARQWLEDLAHEESAPPTPSGAPPRPDWLESPDAARRAGAGGGEAPGAKASEGPTQGGYEIAPMPEDAQGALDPVLFAQESPLGSTDGLAREVPAERSEWLADAVDGDLELFDPGEQGGPSAGVAPGEEPGDGAPSQLFAENELEVPISEAPDSQADVSSGIEPLPEPIPDILLEETPRPPAEEPLQELSQGQPQEMTQGEPDDLAQGEPQELAREQLPPAGPALGGPEVVALPAPAPSGLMDLMADLPVPDAPTDPERPAFDDPLPGSLSIQGLFDADPESVAAAEPPADASSAVTLPEMPAPEVPVVGEASAAPPAAASEVPAEPAPMEAGAPAPELTPAEDLLSPQAFAASRARSRRRLALGLGAAALALAGLGAWRLGARSAPFLPKPPAAAKVEADVAAIPSPLPTAPAAAGAAAQAGTEAQTTAAATPEPSPAAGPAGDKAGAQAAGPEPAASQAGARTAEAEEAKAVPAPTQAGAPAPGAQGASPAQGAAEGEAASAASREAAKEVASLGSVPERHWSPVRIVRRGRVTMGEIRASAPGAVSWQVQPQQRIRAGQALGQLRADPGEAGGAAETIALKAPKAGLLMPAVADKGRCSAGDKLASVVYHEAYLIARATETKPGEDWECRLSDQKLDQREPCHVVTVAPAAGGWAVTATTAALWIDTAPSPRMELAPPPEAAAEREPR